MKTILRVLVLVFLLLANLVIAGDEKVTVDKVTIADKSLVSSGRFSVEWSVEPIASAAGMFEFKAKVIDLATDKVLSEPKINFEKGSGGAQMRSGSMTEPKNPDSMMEIFMQVDIDKDARHFSLSARIIRGKEIIFKQNGSIALP